MRPRHWEQLFTVLDQPQYPDMAFTLSELLDIGVLAQAQLVSQLCTAATGEAKLEDSLKVCISLHSGHITCITVYAVVTSMRLYYVEVSYVQCNCTSGCKIFCVRYAVNVLATWCSKVHDHC
jgi:Dynein heavy chain, N-terminal region 2